MSKKYTYFPKVTGQGETVASNEVKYDGVDASNFDISNGDSLSEIIKEIDSKAKTSKDQYDLQEISVNNVTFGTKIPSATDASDLLDQVVSEIDNVNDTYTKTEVDNNINNSSFYYNLVVDPTPVIDVTSLRNKNTTIILQGNNTTPTAFSISATGTPNVNDIVKFIIDFTAIDNGSTLTIFGTAIYNSALKSKSVVYAFYDGIWNISVLVDVTQAGVLKSNAIDDLDTSISLNTTVQASKAVTDKISVSTAVDLDNDFLKKTGGAVTGSLDLIRATVTVKSPTTANEPTPKNYVDGATSKLSYISVSSAINLDEALTESGNSNPTGIHDFSGGQLKARSPVYSDEVAIKSYVDSKTSIIEDYITLSSVDIQNLHTTPVTLIENPGANSVIELIKVTGYLIFNSVAYTGGGKLDIQYSTGENICALDSSLVTSSTDKIITADNYSVVELKKSTLVNVINTGSAFATGNSTLKIYVLYRVVNLS